MSGYPAEFGIYLSIIKTNKLHKNIKGEFKFVEPDKSIKELHALYNEFFKHLKNKDTPTSLADLYELFQKQPYGLKKGLIPVLLATFFMTKHGSFVDDAGFFPPVIVIVVILENDKARKKFFEYDKLISAQIEPAIISTE